MLLVELRCLLIGVAKGCELCILIVAGKKCERDRRAWAANIILVAVVDFRWPGRIGTAQSVGHNERRMAGEVGGDKLQAGRGR